MVLSGREMRFVNRDEETREALSVLDSLATGISVDLRIREYTGSAASEKPRLLSTIQEGASTLGIPHAFIDLGTISGLDASEFISRVCRETRSQIEQTLPQSASNGLNSISGSLLLDRCSPDNLRELAIAIQPQRVVILVDSLDRYRNDYLRHWQVHSWSLWLSLNAMRSL